MYINNYRLYQDKERAVTNLMSWAADDAGEHSTRCIVSRESGLAHTGPIVHD